MATSQGKWDTEKLRYVLACRLEKKEKDYTKLSNTITTFNENNDTHLSNANILEAILKFMMEDEEESITYSNSFTADALSRASSSQRENADAIFTSNKLDKSEKLVNAINNFTINDAVYELNKAAANDAQVDLAKRSRHS